MRGGPWELSEMVTGQLFDIESDPYESTDRFDEHPEIVKRLVGLLKTAMDSGRTRP